MISAPVQSRTATFHCGSPRSAREARGRCGFLGVRPYLIVATAVLATLACKPRQPSGNTAPPTIMPAVANKFEPKEGSMFLGKPLMSLRLDLESCPYKVFVNGGLVSMHIADAPANEEHPINHFLRFGDNVIEL